MSSTNLLTKRTVRFIIEYIFASSFVLYILYLVAGYPMFIVVLIFLTIYLGYQILRSEEVQRRPKPKAAQPLYTLNDKPVYHALALKNCPDPVKIFNQDMLQALEDDDFQDFILDHYEKGYLNVLPVIYGKDENGKVIFSDLRQAPSLLIAGVSGTGKSTLLHSMLSVLLTYNTQYNLELHLCDTKRVELARYRKFPHTKQLIYNHEQFREFLNQILMEIDQRYTYLQNLELNTVDEYNKLNLGDKMRMPFMLVVIEELGDLMIGTPRDIKDDLIKVLQKGRAAGVHVIALTQRPSAEIVNSSVKANMPNRVALRVASGTDSRIILDRNGAENLTEKGSMLIMDGGNFYQAKSIKTTLADTTKLLEKWLTR